MEGNLIRTHIHTHTQPNHTRDLNKLLNFNSFRISIFCSFPSLFFAIHHSRNLQTHRHTHKSCECDRLLNFFLENSFFFFLNFRSTNQSGGETSPTFLHFSQSTSLSRKGNYCKFFAFNFIFNNHRRVFFCCCFTSFLVFWQFFLLH